MTHGLSNSTGGHMDEYFRVENARQLFYYRWLLVCGNRRLFPVHKVPTAPAYNRVWVGEAALLSVNKAPTAPFTTGFGKGDR